MNWYYRKWWRFAWTRRSIFAADVEDAQGRWTLWTWGHGWSLYWLKERA